MWEALTEMDPDLKRDLKPMHVVKRPDTKIVKKVVHNEKIDSTKRKRTVIGSPSVLKLYILLCTMDFVEFGVARDSCRLVETLPK